MTSMDERIKLARQRMGLSKSALARLLSVTPTSCISWELPEQDRNAAHPNVDNLTRLAVVCNIRFDWLANGQGPMTYMSDGPDAPERLAEPNLLPPDQQELIDLFSQLPTAKRKAVMELLKNLDTAKH